MASQPEQPSRRQLLKKSALGAAAAGVVWSAPKVEGLSLRPDYAAAQTMAGASFDLTALYPPGSASTLVDADSPAPGLNYAALGAFADGAASGLISGPAAATNCFITGFDVLYSDSVGVFNVDFTSASPAISSFQRGGASSGVPTNVTMHVTCT